MDERSWCELNVNVVLGPVEQKEREENPPVAFYPFSLTASLNISFNLARLRLVVALTHTHIRTQHLPAFCFSHFFIFSAPLLFSFSFEGV